MICLHAHLRALRVALVLVVGGLWATPSPAAPASPAREPETNVYLLTFGPGDHPFTKFGHTAIWVERRGRFGRQSTVYNYGTFHADENVISEFLEGRMKYWLSVSPFDSALVPYERTNRKVVAQKLNLSRAQTKELVRRLRDNARPENKYYKYDYYLDNCTTRVRDLIDEVTDGSLRRATEGVPEDFTFREHTLRLTKDDPLLSFGLDLALGPKVDWERDLWAEMFLPEILSEGVAKATIVRKGVEEPLAEPVVTVRESDRPPFAAHPPTRAPWTFSIGLMLGLGVALSGALFHRSAGARRAARVLSLVLTALVALVLGTLGVLISYFWLGTDHEIARLNENILQVSPLAILLSLLSLAAIPWRRLERAVLGLAVFTAAGSFVGLLLELVPGAVQANAEVVALCLPAWLGITAGLFSIVRTPPRADQQRADQPRAN